MALDLKLSKDEKSLLNAIGVEDKLTITVKEDLTAKELVDGITVAASLISKMEKANSVIKPILGRMLLLASNCEGFLEEAGCAKIGDFDKKLTKETGLSRATLYDCRKIYEKFPNLAIEKYQEIGSTKLLIAAKYTSQEETGSGKVLKKAETLTTDEFKAWSVDQGYLGHGDVTGASLSITGSKSQIKAIQSFLDDEECKAHAGSSKPAVIILAALQEASTEWSQANAKEDVGNEPDASDETSDSAPPLPMGEEEE